ncbi:LysR family transcriptional regulator [Pararhodobacter sp. SW119]|uniref:LysR family transcriptional regulator n=1 Tax=Pararhodobacter sp. SW119 TaxID=2780075 RepID=UPI001ADFD6A8|nr:LysR family transcriptional regulator [Pararhodobacter sp. SW119]
MRDLQSITTFAAVARAGSFAEAARRLRISTTAASRHVADLEQALGVQLLQRTTRSVSLTEAGARYLPRAEAILGELDALHAETAAADQTPRGTLRIAAPPGIGHDWIVPLVTDFLADNPAISLDLDLSERLVDLVAEGYDAAIRSGALASSSLIAHRIIEIRYRLCASPAYLDRCGTPETPSQLVDHACLFWCSSGAGPVAEWTFLQSGSSETVPVNCRLRIGSLPALRHAALLGLGLAILPERDVTTDLAEGRLVHVLPDWEIPPESLSLVRPAGAFEPARLRLFIDFITAALRRSGSRSVRNDP